MRTQDFAALLQCILDFAGCEKCRSCRVCPVVLVICVQQPELVVIDDGRVEGANRQLQRSPDLVDPRDALEAYRVFFCIAHVDVCETFLHARLQNVRLCDFNV